MDRSLQAVENLPEGEAVALLAFDGVDALEFDTDESRAAAE
jgi:hypothetical protein